MKLTEKPYQHRRDYDGIYECESCGNKEKYEGCYDDRNFHDNVMPNAKCKKCDKSSKDIGEKDFVQTKYPEGFQV